MIVKKIHILSFAKIAFSILLFIGILIGVFFGASSQRLALSSGLKDVNIVGIWLLSILGIPLLFAFVFLLLGMFLVLIYNLFSELLGGISIDTE